MAFFKRKSPIPKLKESPPLQDLVAERVLTAEGWRRRHPQKEKKSK